MSLDRDLFSVTRGFNLNSSSAQYFKGVDILDVISINYKTGGVFCRPRKVELDNVVFSTECKIANDYTWRYQDKDILNTILLEPCILVPNLQILLKVNEIPDINNNTLLELPDYCEGIIFNFVIYYLLSKQQDNNKYNQLAQKYWDCAISLINLNLNNKLIRQKIELNNKALKHIY